MGQTFFLELLASEFKQRESKLVPKYDVLRRAAAFRSPSIFGIFLSTLPEIHKLGNLLTIAFLLDDSRPIQL